MSVFKIEMKLRKTVTITVEADHLDAIYDVLDNDDLDPDSYWKSKKEEHWNIDPFDVTLILNEEVEGDYVIADTKFGKDFVVKKCE